MLRCSSCDAELRAELKFCDECGTPTSAASAPPPATSASSDATRKTVTALFADLVGSTSFGERADAEVARTVMARYHALLQEAIDAHGGTIAKFMGDGMMATFGIPEIAEDDALRAVRAGVDIQRRFTEFAATVAAQHDETLGLRIGVNTGEVVIASGDADLVGDALNVAARIEHACRPGHVTVGEDTWRLTRGEFGYEALGEVTVAGRAQPVPIYELTADASVVAETSAPFVGRTPEMDRLRAVLAGAISARESRLVTVLGSPGVGKTRLSRELCAATEADDDAITFEIRCDRAGDSTFAPIAQLIRDATDLGDDTDATTARERLGALLADDEADRDRLVDILGGLVGAAPTRSVEETFWAVRRLVSATAVRRPMVVVIDDIQWAEPLLLDLLEHLAEWVRDVPLLLLCLARPELRDVRPSLAERNRRVEDVLALDGLDSAATEALAAGLLGTDRLPAGLVERLPTSTDGNPLFVRELVRMLVDDQVIRRNGDEWELAIDADAVEVPPTIQSLLAARVERLQRDERTVLELASVIGAEFSLGALRELAGADTPLPELLESMRRKELVEPTGTYWGDEPVHRFHHVLIRDAAYRRLLKTTRADLHEKVAVWTDAAAAGLIGEHEAVIAFHYEQAYRYRAELGAVDEHVIGLGRRAAELLAAAADRALGQDDLAAAGTLARRALALLPESDTTARTDLLIAACECTLSSGDVAGARPVVEQLRVEAGDDPTLSAWAWCFEAQLVGLTDPDGLVGAEATATGAAKVMEELSDGAGEAKAHQVRAGLLARLGRVGDAELELDLALGAARRVDDRRRVTAVLGAAPLAALWGPSPVARAGGRCLDVVRLLRITTASPSVEATSMRCQAVLEALRGRFDVARSMLDSSRATLEELGLRHGLLETAYLTGVVELVAGDPAAAIAPLHDAYDGLIEMGVGIDAGRAAALLAHALVAEGRVDDAEPMATASEELAGQDLKTAIAWRVARAEVLAARGDVAAGITLAQEAVEIAAATDLVIDHADACVALAALHAMAGDTAGVRSVRAEAQRLYDLKGATVPSERLADENAVVPAAVAPAAPSPIRKPPERVHSEARHDRAENLATALAGQLMAGFLAGQFDEIRPLLADDAVWIDKRSIIGVELSGADAIIANFRATAEVSYRTVLIEPLAVRGSRLALGRNTMDFGSFESVWLGLAELDADGRFFSITLFDEDALLAALAELDERYFAGEGAAFAPTKRVGFESFTTANARDWDGFRDTYTRDLVCTDRRQIGWPTLDRDGLVATIREYTELAPDLILLPRKVEIRGPATLWTIDATGTTPDGSAVEWVLYPVSLVTPTGISVMELFDEDDFAAALARLDELAAEPTDNRTPDAENLAMTVLARAWELTVAGRAEEVGLLCAEDAVVIDQQRIVGEDLVGRDAIVANSRAVAALGADAARVEPLAVRGSRLALGRTTVSFGSFENVFLSVGEIDAEGLGRCIVTFNEDHLADAIDELDARYLAGPGPHGEETDAGLRALNQQDWNAFRDTLAPDFTHVDHRELGWGTVGRDDFVEMFRGYRELAPEIVFVQRRAHAFGATRLFTVDISATTADGSVIEWCAHVVDVDDPSGHIVRSEMFDEDDFAAALARFDELGTAETTETRTADAVNAAVDAILEIGAQLGRWTAISERFAPDLTLHDRRRLVGGLRSTGRDEVLAADAAVGAVGLDTPIERAVLAVRGDRLALVVGGTATGDGLESTFLTLIELDPEGRVAALDLFDEADLVDALDALDARYEAGDGVPEGVLVSEFPLVSMVNRRDWSALLGPDFPDFTQIDRRQLGWPVVDRHEYVATMQQYVELVPDLVIVARKVLRLGRASLVTTDGSGMTPDGSTVAWTSHSVVAVRPDGRLHMEAFDEDDFPAALARLDELGTAPADPRHPRAENAMTRAWVASAEHGMAQRWDLISAGLSDDFVRLDRRRGISSPTANGPEDFMTSFTAWFEVGFDQFSITPIAVRGDRTALGRFLFRADDGREVAFLSVSSLDQAGRDCRAVHFDEDALVDAIAELDERYIADEGAPHAPMIDDARRTFASLQAEDWAALTTLLPEDFTFVDHRQLSNPPLDRERFVATQQLFAEQVRRQMLVRTLHPVEHALLATIDVTGADAGGGAFEWAFHLLFAAAGARVELFDEDDFPAALARLDELGTDAPADPRHPRAENAASQRLVEIVKLAHARDRAGSRARLTDSFVRLDRRRGVAAPDAHGPDEWVAALDAWFDVGMEHISVQSIAVRGDQLVLARFQVSNPDGAVVPFLGVWETDGSNRFVRAVHFDEDALADAIEELEARYVAGEGAEHAEALRTSADHVRAFRTRDWNALTATLTERAVVVDHRGLWPATDRVGYVARMQTLAETAPDSVLVARNAYFTGTAGLGTLEVNGTTDQGVEIAYTMHCVVVSDRGWARVEYFADDQWDAALARLDELGAASPADARHSRVENATTRTVDQFFDLVLADRFDAAAEHLAPDIVRVDHRTAVADGEIRGRDGYMTALRGAFEVGFTGVTVDHLAVRGERLAVFRSTFTTDTELQLVMLSVGETNADGLVSHLSLYDDDALDDAVAELNDRFAAGEGAPHASILETGRQLTAAMNSPGRAGLTSLLSDDFVAVNHRQLSWPTLDREGFIAAQQSYEDQVSERVLTRSVHLRDRAALGTVKSIGVDADGGHVEWVFHLLTAFGADQRVERMEFFDEADFAAALARLDELGAAPIETAPEHPGHAPPLTNAATRVLQGYAHAFPARDWSWFRRVLAADIVNDDRRPTVSSGRTVGRVETIALTEALASVGFAELTHELIATRGDRLVLCRRAFHQADSFDLEVIAVVGLDDAGQLAHSVLFDPDDLPAALVELDRLYATGEGAEHAAVIQLLAQGYAAMNRRDLDGWAAIHSSDHSSHDHSPIGFGELGTQRYAEYLQAGFDQVPDFVFVPATLQVRGHVALVSVPARGTTPEGFEFESDLIIVTRFDHELQIVEDHFFAPEQLAEARALFETLAAATEPPGTEIHNTVTDVIDRYAAQCAAGDFAGERFVTVDVVRYDRRRGVSTPTLHGLAEFEANMHAIFEVFDSFTTEPIAIRGDRVALIRVHLERDGFDTPMLGVYETDERGLLTQGTSFDEDDFELALDELEGRYLAGEGSEHEYVTRWIRDAARAMRRGGPDAVRSLMAPDFALVDHRTLGYGTVDLADLTTLQAARDEQVTDDLKLHRTREIRGDVILAWYDTHASAPDGGEYTWSHWVIWQLAAGRWIRLEMFDLDDEVAARARFEELAAETRTPYIDNAVVRKIARGLWLQQYGEQADSSAEYADDVVLDDRRTGVTLPQLHGAEQLIEASRAQDELFGPTAIEPVAVRGDRLALMHTRAVSPSGFEVVGYMTFEIGDDGRFCRMVCFDDTDLVAALDALEQRHAELAGSALPASEATAVKGIQALNHRDWDAFEWIHHPEMVALDHTPLGFAPTDRDGFLNEQMRGLDALVEDFVVVPAKIMTSGSAVLVVGHGKGTTVEGSTYEWHWVCAGRVVDGLVTRQEFFDDTDWAAALARFDELAAEPATARTEPENRLTRQLRESIVLAERGDPTYADVLADDVVILDRRSGISAGTITGRADFTANARAHFDVFVHASPTILAVRGDRLALVRMEFQADGFVSVRLNLFETDEDGQLVALVVLDEDALAAALEELEARHTAIETGP